MMIFFVWGKETLPQENIPLGFEPSTIIQEIGFEKGDKILDVDGKELKILKGRTKVLSTAESIHVEIEGRNLEENLKDIEEIVSLAGLVEEESWRNKGSGRNRLYLRK